MPRTTTSRREPRADERRERARRRPSAKTISSPDEHADRNGQTLATKNHDVIRRWAKERDAVPATVASTERGNRPGVLRFRFGDSESGRLEKIDWKDWFQTFDERDLTFLYQERLRNGNQSNFFRFDNPRREDA